MPPGGVPSDSWATQSLGSGCTLKHSRASCLLITLSSSSALASLSWSITPISGRMYSWACSGVARGSGQTPNEWWQNGDGWSWISPPYVLKLDNVAPAAGLLFFLGRKSGGCDLSAGDWTVLAATSASHLWMGRPALKLGSIYECRQMARGDYFIAIFFAFLGPCYKKFCTFVNYLTLGGEKMCKPLGGTQCDVEGMQMRAWMVGIAAVVAIGLIWSVAVMSNLIPVDGSEMSLASISRPAE